MKIQNIIFDYGGVILNINPDLIGQYLYKMGIKNVSRIHMDILEKDLYNKIETGDISPEAYVDELRKIIGNDISKEEVINAWNALILDMPPERIKLLENLKNRYRIFLLSNTNAIHYDKYRSELEKHFNYKTFDEIFEKSFFSHDIGFRKPDVRIFEYVIEKAGINTTETIFIDDSFENVEAAEKAGLIGLHLREGIEITDLFDEEDLLIGI